MALAFRTHTEPIPNGTGQRDRPVKLGMGGHVNLAEVAIKAFTLDFVGPNVDHHIDIVKVGTTKATPVGDDVEFNITCQYADRDRRDEYSGSVEVLVIADVTQP
jgi:hypothetical protein